MRLAVTWSVGGRRAQQCVSWGQRLWRLGAGALHSVKTGREPVSYDYFRGNQRSVAKSGAQPGCRDQQRVCCVWIPPGCMLGCVQGVCASLCCVLGAVHCFGLIGRLFSGD